MIHILFVDDEINILDSLKRFFYKNRKEWNMSFVSSGEQAIEHLENNKVDILVTDMKMPEMSGVELLRIVQSRFSNVIRIALSGHAEQEMLLESIGLFHQYYSKPCETALLEEGINEAYKLSSILNDDYTRGAITKEKSLPVIPEIYTKIQRYVCDPEASLNDISKLIEDDVALSANILRFINTPFFGLKTTITHIKQAVTLLGVDLIKNMILMVNVFHKSSVVIEGFSLNELMKHSVRVATFCKVIAKHEGVADNELDKFFIAGLLHDVGKILFYNNHTEQYKLVISSIDSSVKSITESEEKIIGVTHAQVGAYLLGLWGFDKEITYVISNHHGLISEEYKSSLLLKVLYSANLIDHRLVRLNKDYVEREIDEEVVCKFLLQEDFAKWSKLIKEYLEVHND